MSINLEQLSSYTLQDIAALDVHELRQLTEEANANLDKAKLIKDRLESAIAFKYDTRLQSLRDTQAKYTGVVRIEDDGISISADRSKKITWSQEKLADISEKIRQNNEDPGEFIDISYKISERKYNAWPKQLQASFAPARTLKYGKQTITFSGAKERSQ